ncbi:hypothetical protein PINS_up006637 [Pythium insidiosum]|nr:hypothetical protein PINS_up006637 [Pythium insidiosum]
MFARRTAAEIALSIRKSVLCAEAKKLTTLALQRSPIFQKQTPLSVSAMPSLSASASASSSASVELQSVTATRQLSPDKCAICFSEPSYLNAKSMTWCKICGTTVCSKCRSHKYLLTDDGKLRVACCKQCIIAARQLRVDPRKQLELIPMGQWLAYVINHRPLARSIGPMPPTNSSSVAEADSVHSQHACEDFADTSSSLPSTYQSDRLLSMSSSLSDLDSLLRSPGSTRSSDVDVDAPQGQHAPSRSFSHAAIMEEDDEPLPLATTKSMVTIPVSRQQQDHRHHLSLYSQMCKLREQAEDTYTMTRATSSGMLRSQQQDATRRPMLTQ